MVPNAVVRVRRKVVFSAVSALSLCRIPLSGLFLFLYLDPSPMLRRYGFALLALIVVTDVADGIIARRFRVTTKWGYILDGVGDRAGYVAVILAIAWRDGFPLILGYAIILRDFLLYGTRAYYPTWYCNLDTQRRIAKWHAGALRLVFFAYLAADARALFMKRPPSAAVINVFAILPVIVAILVIGSYYSFWLIFREQGRSSGVSPFEELADEPVTRREESLR